MSDTTHISIFATGFVQVFFVAINTYFISKLFFVGILLCGFTISFIWSWNVKRIAFSSLSDRIIYSVGASLGCAAGAFLSQYLVR